MYQGRCATHVIITNGPSVCRSREENYDINNGLIKRPIYCKKKHLTKISCSIGKFHNVHYQQMLKNYSYHRILLCLIDKNECKILEMPHFLNMINLNVNVYAQILNLE